MKLALVDCTNFSLVFVHEPAEVYMMQKLRWDFDILRSCILDTQVNRISSSSPIHNQITNDAITNSCFILDRGNGFIVGNPLEKNSFNIAKQDKARLIFPLIEFLTFSIHNKALNFLNVFGVPIDDTLAVEVTASNPKLEYYTPGIIEYAKILAITPAQAYQELKLEYQTAHSIKVRSYAIVKKYQAIIRNIATKEQADALYNELYDRLIKETSL